MAIENYAGDGSRYHEILIASPVDNQTHPVVIYIHGGCWAYTFDDWTTKACNAIHAATHGFVGVSINYSLTRHGKTNPQDPRWKYWPDQLDDAKHAVGWLKNHAGKYGIDPGKIYTIGHSAGGHIALMLALTNSDIQNPNYRYDSSGDIQGACTVAGASDLFRIYYESIFPIDNLPSVVNDLLDNPLMHVTDNCDNCSGTNSFCYLNRCRTNPDGEIALASPIYNLPQDTSGLVPIFMVSGMGDEISPKKGQHTPFYSLLSPDKKKELTYPCGHDFGFWWDDIDHKAYDFFSSH